MRRRRWSIRALIERAPGNALAFAASMRGARPCLPCGLIQAPVCHGYNNTTLFRIGGVRRSAVLGAPWSFPRDGGHRRARRGLSNPPTNVGQAGRAARDASITPVAMTPRHAVSGWRGIICVCRPRSHPPSWNSCIEPGCVLRVSSPRPIPRARPRTPRNRGASGLRYRMAVSGDLIPSTSRRSRSTVRHATSPYIKLALFTPPVRDIFARIHRAHALSPGQPPESGRTAVLTAPWVCFSASPIVSAKSRQLPFRSWVNRSK